MTLRLSAFMTVTTVCGLVVALLGSAPAQTPATSHAFPPAEPTLEWQPTTRLGHHYGHAMAYDPVREVVVLFGGFGSSYGSNTWEWDGKQWKRRIPRHVPLGRLAAAMAFCPVRKTVIMYGGQAWNYQNLSDMWEWDGSDWHPIHPPASPGIRAGVVMASDPLRNQVLLYGGTRSTTLPLQGLGDTWVWDGRTWTQQQPPSQPRPRFDHSMTFDPRTGRVMMIGGWYVSNWLAGDEVFEWDGQDWIRSQPQFRPPPLPYPVLAFDPGLNEVVMHDSTVSNSSSEHTWSWDGQRWQLLKTANRPLQHTRGWVGATDVARGQMIVIGFASSHLVGGNLGAATWTITNGDWRQIDVEDNFPDTYNFPEVVHDAARDEFLVVGSRKVGTQFVQAFWVQRNSRFVPLQPKTIPPARHDSVLLYHPPTRRVVMMGGFSLANNAWLFDIWTWDGNDWQEHPLSKQGPVPPVIMLAVYDNHRDKIVHFPANNGEMWEWDYQQGWNRRVAATVPPPLGDLVYDFGRRRTALIHPGTGYTGEGELWDWDGVDWQKYPQPLPPNIGRSAYSPDLGGIVMLPGPNRHPYTGRRSETAWFFDGTMFSKMPGSTGSFKLPFTAQWRLAYDANRQRLRASSHYPSMPEYDLEIRHLFPRVAYARPGRSVSLDVVYPAHPGRRFWTLLSTEEWPGIPVRQVPFLGTQVLPIGPSPLLQASMAAPMITTLDPTGRGIISVAIPNIAALIGTEFHAAGVLLGNPQGSIDAISNRVELGVIK